MVQRRHHYEYAFEEFLRAHRIPYLAVDEARKVLLPDHAGEAAALKSFDFVIYSDEANLLVDVKGRRIARRAAGPAGWDGRPGSMQNWVTRADIASLEAWEGLFGDGFRAAFIFMYWCDAQPPDGLFQELFRHRGRWYALRSVRLADYRTSMKPRSERWGTVHVPTRTFEQISEPFRPEVASGVEPIRSGARTVQGSRRRAGRQTMSPRPESGFRFPPP